MEFHRRFAGTPNPGRTGHRWRRRRPPLCHAAVVPTGPVAVRDATSADLPAIVAIQNALLTTTTIEWTHQPDHRKRVPPRLKNQRKRNRNRLTTTIRLSKPSRDPL